MWTSSLLQFIRGTPAILQLLMSSRISSLQRPVKAQDISDRDEIYVTHNQMLQDVARLMCFCCSFSQCDNIIQ